MKFLGLHRDSRRRHGDARRKGRLIKNVKLKIDVETPDI
jgi:hypothetical protein